MEADINALSGIPVPLRVEKSLPASDVDVLHPQSEPEGGEFADSSRQAGSRASLAKVLRRNALLKTLTLPAFLRAGMDTVFMGWLEKRGWWSLEYKCRFFVLRRTTGTNEYYLFYYTAPDAKQPNGVIPLKGATLTFGHEGEREVVDILPLDSKRHFVLRALCDLDPAEPATLGGSRSSTLLIPYSVDILLKAKPQSLADWQRKLQAAMEEMKGRALLRLQSDIHRGKASLADGLEGANESDDMAQDAEPPPPAELANATMPRSQSIRKPLTRRSLKTTKPNPEQTGHASRPLADATVVPLNEIEELLGDPDKPNKQNSEKRRRLCRRGFAYDQRRIVWQRLVRLHAASSPKAGQLDQHASLLFKDWNGVMPEVLPHTPTFGSALEWHTLNRSTRRILCVLAWRHPDVTHCPVLPDLLATLLMFLAPPEAFDTCELMLLRSMEDEFYFTLGRRSFGRSALTFDVLATNLVGDVAQHMRALGVPPYAVFADWYARMFVLLAHPLSLIFRFFDAFLNEGFKVCYRLALGVLEANRVHLLTTSTADEFLNMLDTVICHPTTTDPLFNGFRLKMSRAQIKAISKSFDKREQEAVAQYVSPASHQIFRLPTLPDESDVVLTHAEILQLWSWLPDHLSIADPVVVFSTARDGFSLRNLYERCRAEREAACVDPGCLLVVQDTKGNVFGAYSPVLFSLSQQPSTPSGDWFAFTLRPEVRCFHMRTEPHNGGQDAGRNDLGTDDEAVSENHLARDLSTCNPLMLDMAASDITNAPRLDVANSPRQDMTRPDLTGAPTPGIARLDMSRPDMIRLHSTPDLCDLASLATEPWGVPPPYVASLETQPSKQVRWVVDLISTSQLLSIGEVLSLNSNLTTGTTRYSPLFGNPPLGPHSAQQEDQLERTYAVNTVECYAFSA